MQEEMIKNVSNIEKYQPFSLLHDQIVLLNRPEILKKSSMHAAAAACVH